MHYWCAAEHTAAVPPVSIQTPYCCTLCVHPDPTAVPPVSIQTLLLYPLCPSRPTPTHTAGWLSNTLA